MFYVYVLIILGTLPANEWRKCDSPQEAALSTPSISRFRAATPHDGDEPDGAPRLVIRPRRGLPGGRSVVGGLLVTLAAMLAWWAATGGQGGPTQTYLVAAHALGPGERIGPGDTRAVTVDLPPGLRSRVFADTHGLEGAVVLGPIDGGELIQAGSVSSGDQGPERELAFAVSSTWAVGGDLRPGDQIDVFATYGDGTSSQTIRVLTRATIRRLAAAGGDGLGETRSQTITVALGPDSAAESVVNAARASTITVVRVTGTPSAIPDQRYRAVDDLGAKEMGG
ncbi:MAG: hypothetical protein ABIP03_13975 [Aquihabitans sp.]